MVFCQRERVDVIGSGGCSGRGDGGGGRSGREGIGQSGVLLRSWGELIAVKDVSIVRRRSINSSD